MLSVSPIIIFWQACPTLARGREKKNSSLPSAQQYAITFRRWPIVVSFNVISGTLSKTNDFTKHAHELNHLNFHTVFNLSVQYQGRFWLVCSNAQSTLHLRWLPKIKNINICWVDLDITASLYNKLPRSVNPTIYKHGYLRSVRMTSSCLKMMRLP